MMLLNDLITNYPSFQPNQVLTREALNNLTNYLEQQDRLTRQKLIGIGIICGLDINLDKSDINNIIITISQGVGLTSEGYLICLDTSDCTHKRLFIDRASYSFFINRTNNQPYSILEILPDPGVTSDGTITKLTATDINDKIVVLYLEILENTINQCLDESCDEKGKLWNFTIRKLLIDRNDMEGILRKSYDDLDNKDLDDYFNPAYGLPEVYLERFGYQVAPPQLKLTEITNLKNFVQGYDPAIRQGGLRLAQALSQLYTLYKPLFDIQLSLTSNLFAGYDDNDPKTNPFTKKLLTLINNSNSSISVQYIYDFLRDLIATYEELVEKLFELTSECSPNPSLFPRHLMLGELQENALGQFSPSRYSLPTVFRHHFISAPIYNHGSDLLLNVKQLIQRLISQIQLFDYDASFVDGNTEIKITPSLDCRSPLGKQAIPFYYQVNTGDRPLWQDWDFATSKRNWSKRILGYYSNEYTDNPQVVNPLLYDICKYPKLRIEGHVGLKLTQAIEQLTQIKNQYNLSFDIIALKLDNPNRNFHKVYLPDESKIADLQALYLIERNDLVCCLRDIIKILEQNQKAMPYIISFFLYYSLYIERENRDFNVIYQTYIVVNNFYLLYLETLQNLVLQLPLNLKDFQLHEFEDVYTLANSMSSMIKYFINIWGDVELLFIKPFRENEATAIIFSDLLSVILNAFELLLDKILDDCLQARFATIYNLFIERVEKLCLFSRFTAKISGIEHIAGTQKGGTFILVYEEMAPSRIIEGIVKDTDSQESISGVKVSIVSRKVPIAFTNDNGKFTVDVPEGLITLTLTKVGYDVKQINLEEENNKVEATMTPIKRRDSITPGIITRERTSIPAFVRDFENIAVEIDRLTKLDQAFKELKTEIFERETIKIIDFRENKQFRVVGDFYYPCCLPNNQLEITPLEVCPDKGKKQFLNLEAIVKQLNERIKISPEIKEFREKFRI